MIRRFGPLVIGQLKPRTAVRQPEEAYCRRELASRVVCYGKGNFESIVPVVMVEESMQKMRIREPDNFLRRAPTVYDLFRVQLAMVLDSSASGQKAILRTNQSRHNVLA